MILETIRCVADSLATGSYGVNAQLSSLTLDAGDAAPPSLVGVYDETRSNEVAVGRYPRSYPNLVVTLADNVSLNGEVVSDNRDATVVVLIRYVQKDVDSASAKANAYYTMRATEKSLRTFFSNAQNADRNRNDIQIIECTNLEHITLFDNIEDAMVTTGLRVTMFVRDTQP